MEPALPLVLSAGWAAGVNSYATVALLCIAGRADLLEVPAALERTDVLAGALVMFCVEFVADKIPWFDSLWDVVHTAIRPLTGGTLGALLAGQDDARATVEALGGAGGGLTALASHSVKASVRLAINGSPEPFTNIAVSLGEDLAVAGVVMLATAHPWAALAVVVVLLAAGVSLALFLAKRIRGGWLKLRERRARPDI